MKKKRVDGHMTVTAKSGYFVWTADKAVFGKTLSLGCNTTAAEILELPEDGWPKVEEIEEDN